MTARQSGNDRGGQTILVLGASGTLGTGFAQAVLDLRRSARWRPEVVVATRSTLPDGHPWSTLRGVDGVRIEQISASFGAAELDALIRDTDARTVVNCIGNTNMIVPYRELRSANVDLVRTIAGACASHAAALVHLSTFVVNADVAAPQVVDPRKAPYPYAASKSLAELVVARSSDELDFTIVRLPRVLGDADRIRDSADILVSIVDACIDLGAFPSVPLTEQVTTADAVASAVMGRLPESTGSGGLGRGITVVRGEEVAYTDFLNQFARDELDPVDWKQQLDRSDWAKRNPRRWSVIDAWMSLGLRLGTRSYPEYLAEYPAIDLEVDTVAELEATPRSIRSLLTHRCPKLLR